MSKRMTRISGLLLRSIAGWLIVCGCVSLNEGTVLGQDKGFSIFEPAEESTAPVVAPKDAFTNPNAKLSPSQFGTFENAKVQSAQVKPKLEGSRPDGTYAHDGRSMFRQAPKPGSSETGKLQPFAPNSLRVEDRPQPDTAPGVASETPPIVVGDFQSSARRLPVLTKNPPQNPAAAKPKIAQVAFQDGGGFDQNRPQGGSPPSRFGQTTGSRFGQQSSSSNSGPSRFGGNNSRPQQRGPLAPSQLGRSQLGQTRSQLNPQQRQPLSASSNMPRTGQTISQNNQGLRTTPRSGFSNARGQQQNPQTPAARTASLNQPTPPVRGKAGTTPSPSAKTKTTSTGAKALLNGWVEENPELKLPGKRLKLHEFLAQSINGSKKDAINQYWVTFNDMANHKLAVEQSQWLSSMSNPRQQADLAVLKAAQQAAQNRVLHTEIQLAKSQSILGDFLPNLRYKNGKNIPVLPADIPWVGKLNTKLQEYKSRGIVPARFNAIDEILPKARQLIINRAEAVAAASQAAEQSKTAMRNGQTPVSNVLEAVRIMAKNQADFLSTVTGYNRAITDYVLSVRQDIYQPKRLASVLIGRKSVQKSKTNVAKDDGPQEDTDPMMNPSNPKMRQISTGRKAGSSKPQSLQGQSAYQNGPESNIEDSLQTQQESKSPFASASSSRPVAKSQSQFEYGPTKESAAAANFDPAKVREELPMAQAKPSSNNAAYEGNSVRAGANQNRSANRSNGGGGVRQPFGGQNGRGGSATGNSNPVAQPRTNGSTGQRTQLGQAQPPQPAVNRFDPSAASQGGLGGAGSMERGGAFSPSVTSPPAERAPAIPKSGPFSEVSPSAAAPTGETTSSRLNSAFGGAGGTAPKPPSTASRFGNPGFDPTRR